jgi:ABC-type lipoprotein release transport system permease subunit
LALVIGLAGGGVTALAAGARRTESVYERFLARSAPSDLLVLDSSELNPEAQVDLRAAAGLSGVAHSARVQGLFALGGEADGRALPPFPVAVFSGPASDLGERLERPLLLGGRLADPDAIDEMVVSFEVARRFDLAPGSTLALDMIRADALVPAASELLGGLVDRLAGRDPGSSDMAAAAGARRFTFTVVGIASSPMDFPPVPGTLQPIVYVTPAFHAESGRELAGSGILIVSLDPDAEVGDYKAALEADNEGRDVTYAGGGVDRFRSAQRSIDLQAQALWLLTALVAVAVTLIAAQLLARQVVLESTDDTTLWALGMGRRQVLAGAALRAVAIAAAAAVVVVGVAMALSPLFPIGTGAAAEPDPGVHIDSAAVAAGVLFTATGAFAFSIGAAWRQSRRVREESGHRRLAGHLGVVPLTLHLGGRLALEPGHGRAAVPVRSTLAALTVAVATAALSLTFVASLDHLTRTPRLYGWAWDVQIGGVAVPDISDLLVEGLQQNPAVQNLAVGTISQLDVDGRRVDGYAVDDVQGQVSAAVLEGRAPTAANEIALGSVTLEEAGLAVGDRVEVGAGGRRVEMQIVGRSVFPNLGDAGQLGRGARLTFAGIESISPGSLRGVTLVDFTDESDAAREVDRLREVMDVYPVYDDQRPDDLVNFGEARAFPAVVVTTVAAVIAATLLHTLLTSIRRRRADLAVLKTLGFSRGQISRTVAAQATVLVGTALLIGVPLGVAAGRSAWTLVAHRYGFASEPQAPPEILLALAATMVVFANLVAYGPAWTAGRTPAARVLRTE